MMSYLLPYLLFAVLSAVLIQQSSGFEVPFLGSCTITDEECHKKCVRKFFDMYGHGIPDLDVPTMEPMSLGDIIINGNSNENFNLKISMQDIKLFKYTVGECLGVKGFSNDTSKPITIVIKGFSPEIIMRTHCKIKGKVLIFNVEGETDLEIHIKNLTTVMTSTADFYTKNNHTYMKVKKISPKLHIGSLKVDFENSTLFGGNQEFAEAFSDTINENWMVLRDEVQPHLDRANSKISKDILDKVLLSMPYDQFFKEGSNGNE